MNVKLQQLELTNYRNINHYVLNFDGNSQIIGENRIGKTSILESIYWLLTDKLLNGSKDIEQIKPLNDTKKAVEVTATFDVDGKNHKIGKVYQEEWVKTRGTEDLVFKGHSTTYYYDGVKQGTKKDFELLFNNDFGLNGKMAFQGIDTLQMLTNPLYLGNMGDDDGWKNLRSLIIAVVGDVTDEDVFNNNDYLLPIKEDLELASGRTDQITKRYRDDIEGLKTDIIGCDANISLLEKVEKPLDESVEIAKQGIEEMDAKIRSLSSSDANDKALDIIEKEIIDLRNKIIEIKQEDYKKKSNNPVINKANELIEKKDNLFTELQDVNTKRTQILLDISNTERDITYGQSQVDEMQAVRKNLIDELQDIDKKMKDPDFEKECPHCHRPYEEDKIEELLTEVLKGLNERKANLISKGKDNTLKMNEKVEEVNTLKNKLEELKTELSRVESSGVVISTSIKEVSSELEALKTEDVEEVVNPEIEKLESQIKFKQQEKNDLRNSIDAQDETTRSLIVDAQSRKDNFQRVIDDYNYYLRTQKQLDETKSKKADLSKKQIQLEQKMELVKMFIKAKLEMLNQHIKREFGDLSFMLIEPQINGGYSSVCKPYIKGTDTLWKSGSKSEKITTGIAICEKIKERFGYSSFPYLFDEGGEVSNNTFKNIIKTDSQIICVKVKDGVMIPTVINL